MLDKIFACIHQQQLDTVLSRSSAEIETVRTVWGFQFFCDLENFRISKCRLGHSTVEKTYRLSTFDVTLTS